MAYSLNLHAPDHQTSSWELGEHTSPSTVNPSRKTLLAKLKASNARYEGSRKNDAAIESDAQKLNKAVRNGDKTMLIKDEEIILDSAMKANATKNEQEALTRVIVTRTDVDMKDIAEEYNKQYGTPLAKKIEDVAIGNYKDFLVTLVQRALAK
ncbi:annexin D4-like [Vitis vinifera]|uniref:annexin D4-like n=1 Tax=Vitis vinifera TaxID=29760 RepID=UPI0028830F87|nr:annexin D4-like [Vitis vinifera]